MLQRALLCPNCGCQSETPEHAAHHINHQCPAALVSCPTENAEACPFSHLHSKNNNNQQQQRQASWQNNSSSSSNQISFAKKSHLLRRDQLQRHMDLECDQSGKSTFSCQDCGQSDFNSYKEWNNHVEPFCPLSVPPPCPLCKEMLSVATQPLDSRILLAQHLVECSQKFLVNTSKVRVNDKTATSTFMMSPKINQEVLTGGISFAESSTTSSSSPSSTTSSTCSPSPLSPQQQGANGIINTGKQQQQQQRNIHTHHHQSASSASASISVVPIPSSISGLSSSSSALQNNNNNDNNRQRSNSSSSSSSIMMNRRSRIAQIANQRLQGVRMNSVSDISGMEEDENKETSVQPSTGRGNSSSSSSSSMVRTATTSISIEDQQQHHQHQNQSKKLGPWNSKHETEKTASFKVTEKAENQLRQEHHFVSTSPSLALSSASRARRRQGQIVGYARDSSSSSDEENNDTNDTYVEHDETDQSRHVHHDPSPSAAAAALSFSPSPRINDAIISRSLFHDHQDKQTTAHVAATTTKRGLTNTVMLPQSSKTRTTTPKGAKSSLLSASSFVFRDPLASTRNLKHITNNSITATGATTPISSSSSLNNSTSSFGFPSHRQQHTGNQNGKKTPPTHHHQNQNRQFNRQNNSSLFLASPAATITTTSASASSSSSRLGRRTTPTSSTATTAMTTKRVSTPTSSMLGKKNNNSEPTKAFIPHPISRSSNSSKNSSTSSLLNSSKMNTKNNKGFVL